jgi:hypothetical protein
LDHGTRLTPSDRELPKHMRVMLQGYLGIHTATHKEHGKI